MARAAVYDKAKWHFKGLVPKSLALEQAYVHIGMFLTWIIDHDLYNEEFLEDFRDEITLVKGRQTTGTSVYEEGDGALTEDMLNGEGNAFAGYYYSTNSKAEPHYLKDYIVVLAPGLDSAYEVQDSWDNYRKIATRIDERYQEWITSGRPQGSTIAS